MPEAFKKVRAAARRLKALVSGAPKYPIDAFLRDCRSIIHVGANLGQERDLYRKRGLAVLWVEPIPALFEKLETNLTGYSNQTAVRAFLSSRTDERLVLNIANNGGASSSIFPLGLHKDVWAEVSYVDSIEVTSSTLDEVLPRVGRRPLDALVLDTQGSELLVLQGGEKAVSEVRYIKTEAADFEAYIGGATVDSLTAHLGQRGFRLKSKAPFAHHPAGGRYFDVLFERVNCSVAK